jgi:phosphate uptake regulator
MTSMTMNYDLVSFGDAAARTEALDRIHGRVEGALRECRRSVALARDGLITIKDEIAAYVRERTRGLDEARRSDSLTRAFQLLDDRVSSHLDVILVEVERQQEIATRAATRCTEMMAAAKKLERIASAARLMSQNASIGAASIADGRTISVLASTLSELTSDVSAINAKVARLAEVLLRVLPAVAARADEVKKRALEFSARFRESVARLGPKADALTRAVTDGHASGDRRVANLLAKSNEALGALEFDDAFTRAIVDLRGAATAIEIVVAAPARARHETEH